MILEGELDLIYFNDIGEIKEIFELSDANSGKPFFLRSENELWHTLLIKSDYVILIETTNGPLNKKLTKFAEWSPESDNLDKVNSYLKELENTVKNA